MTETGRGTVARLVQYAEHGKLVVQPTAKFNRPKLLLFLTAQNSFPVPGMRPKAPTTGINTGPLTAR